MPSFDQLIRNFEAATVGLKKQVEDNLLTTANEASNSIVKRIQGTGKDDEGQPFRDYTPQYKLRKAGLTKKKIKRATKKLNKALESGSDFNSKTLDSAVGIRGKYQGFVDFTLTGEMMRSVGVQGKSSGNGMATVTVSVNSRNEDLLAKNVKQRGEILVLSKKEKTQLEKEFNVRNENYFKNKLRL